jgi:antitoxin HigA-1
MKRMMKPAHPGLILAEQFAFLHLKVQPTARILGISRQQLHRVLIGKAPVSADLAVKIGHMLGNGTRIWTAMQADYDAWEAEKRLGGSIEDIPVLGV